MLEYSDTVQLVKAKLSDDGYATEVVDEITDVDALFVAETGFQHGNHQDSIRSSSSVYLDPTNDYIIDNHNRLEGMYVIANMFGEDESAAWYKITSVIVGQDKLLLNEIDNVQCHLEKSTEIKYVS